MEFNRENLTAQFKTANIQDIVVLDQWPGERKTAAGCFFVMHRKTECLLKHTPSTAVLSSRLPKILDSHRRWFDAIRTVGVKISQSHDILLTGETTAAHPCCLRLGELFSTNVLTIKQLSIESLRKDLSKERWQYRLSSGIIFCVIQQNTKMDRLLVEIADNVFALSVGKNGNVEKALQHRLTSGDKSGRTFTLHDNTLTPKSVRESLLAAGAVDWLLLPHDEAKPATTDTIITKHRDLSDLDQSEYLIHWTRARPGAWPDQSAEDHWDDLIFGSGGFNHSDVYSLCRILASRRIIASANLTRDSTPVVCFSNVPLGKLRDKTIFRKHLQRWDFLPYGIAIKRSTLTQQFDCRPVIYGSDETWKTLPDSDRPFFQLKKTSDQKIDWQEEHEWRVIGDVDLRKVDLSDAVVFTGNEKDLEKLSQLSIFDLIVI